VLDEAATRNLELVRTLSGDRKGSLLHFVDRTRTAMGARLLRRRLLAPLMDVASIRRRHDAVEAFVLAEPLRGRLRELLQGVGVLERLTTKATLGVASPRDLGAILGALRQADAVDALLRAHADSSTDDAIGRLLPNDLVPEVKDELAAILVDEPPANARDGGIVREGVDADLDELRTLSSRSKDVVLELEQRALGRVVVENPKIGYNRVFGYYIEITNAHAGKAPAEFTRRQTLRNAERYVTPELKSFEDKVLSAEGRANARERALFDELCGEAAAHLADLVRFADAVASLDAVGSLAEVAARHRARARHQVLHRLEQHLRGEDRAVDRAEQRHQQHERERDAEAVLERLAQGLDVRVGRARPVDGLGELRETARRIVGGDHEARILRPEQTAGDRRRRADEVVGTGERLEAHIVGAVGDPAQQLRGRTGGQGVGHRAARDAEDARVLAVDDDLVGAARRELAVELDQHLARGQPGEALGEALGDLAVLAQQQIAHRARQRRRIVEPLLHLVAEPAVDAAVEEAEREQVHGDERQRHQRAEHGGGARGEAGAGIAAPPGRDQLHDLARDQHREHQHRDRARQQHDRLQPLELRRVLHRQRQRHQGAHRHQRRERQQRERARAFHRGSDHVYHSPSSCQSSDQNISTRSASVRRPRRTVARRFTKHSPGGTCAATSTGQACT